MILSDEFLEELRMKTDMESIISPYVNLRKRGKNLVGLCPFHNEKTPSFTVYPENQSFYCFGCGVGGDVITFVRRIENLDYIEAVKFLAEKANMNMPEDGYDDSLGKLRTRIFAANREAARFFYNQLISPAGKNALEYLKNRGYTNSTIKKFGMGYAPNEWSALLDYLKGKGFSIQELVAANLVRTSRKGDRIYYYDNFKNRVIVPIIDLRGNVVAFGGRVLDDSKPKYVNTSDTPVYKKGQGLFALNFAKNGNDGKLILVEGYMDAIMLHQAGFQNTIAGLGTALTSEQVNVISRYADEVILSYDNDEAGQAATKKALNLFKQIGMKVRVLKLSGGKDPDEIIKKYGSERFRQLMESAANSTEYKLLNEREKHDLQTSDGKLDFFNATVKILSQVESPIERDIYVSKLANEFEVNKEAMLAQISYEMKKNARKGKTEEIKAAQNLIKDTKSNINPQKKQYFKAARAEEILLASLINNPDFFKNVDELIEPETFITDLNKKIFSLLSDRIRNGKQIEVSFLLEDLNEDEINYFTWLQTMKSTISNTIEECEDCINVIKSEKEKQKAIKPSELNDEDFKKLFK